VTASMMCMRVLAVTPWFPCAKLPGSGLFNLRDSELIATDHEVTVLHLIAPSHMDSDEPAVGTAGTKGLRVVRQPFALSNPKLIKQAVAAIRREAAQADLMHTMAFPALLPGRLARLRKPWVHTEHYSSLVTPPASARMAMALGTLKRFFKHPDEVIAVSRALADVVDQYRSTPATVIGNEVMEPTGVVPVRGDLSSSVAMIGVGGIIDRKGPLPAVDTVAELQRRGIDATLTWVGEGDQRAEVLASAERQGIADKVRLAGQLEPAELSAELLTHDLFLLPVETETFGVALAEALAHGLPIVATGTGGHEEFLPGEASRLIQRREGAPLADAVQDILADPALWSRQQIADYAAGMFSGAHRLRAYREVYESAVARTR